MSKTSNEVKLKWIKKAYSRYTISLRKDSDGELIDLIESMKASGKTTTEVFRELLKGGVK